MESSFNISEDGVSSDFYIVMILRLRCQQRKIFGKLVIFERAHTENMELDLTFAPQAPQGKYSSKAGGFKEEW